MVDSTFLDDLFAAPAPVVTGAAAVTTTIEFTIKRFVLDTLIGKAGTVVPTRDVMPVLKNLQLHAHPGQLRVVGSDGEMSIIATTGLVQVSAPGTAVFLARKLADICKEADEGDVHIRVDGTRAVVRIGRAEWNLVLVSGADYPGMPDIGEAAYRTVDRAGYLDALTAVRYAACRAAERANLMIIDVTDGRMIACDGARVAQAAVTDTGFSHQIPISAVDLLVKLLKNCGHDTIAVGESGDRLIYRFGEDTFIVNKLLAAFPDSEALYLRPALANTDPLAVERGDLVDAIRRVRISADANTAAIALHLEPGRLTVSARDRLGNTARETVDADWTGPTRTLAVNHTFLTDLIAQHPGTTLRFLLGDDTQTRRSPLLLRDPDAGTTGVVQQMKIDWVAS